MIFELMQEYARVREHLLPAIERTNGTHTEDDVIAALLNGQFKLWALEKSVGITEFQIYPRMKILNVFLAGGDLTEIMAHTPVLEAYGLKNGCSRMTFGGRPGWEPVMSEHGYKRGGVFLYKDL